MNKSAIFTFRMTPTERAKLAEITKASGLSSAADWFRLTINAAHAEMHGKSLTPRHVMSGLVGGPGPGERGGHV